MSGGDISGVERSVERSSVAAPVVDVDLPELLAQLETMVDTIASRLQSAVNSPIGLREDGDELGDLVVRAERLSSRTAAVAAVLAGEWDRCRAWRRAGHRSPASALSTIASLSPRSARRDLRRGRAMNAMPATCSAVLAGDLTVDHLDLLSRADQPWRHELFGHHEKVLVEHVSSLRWPDATRLVDYWVQRVDADASADSAHLRGLDVHCWCSATLEGQIAIDALLDPVGGEIVNDELERLTQLEYRKDLTSGVHRTPSQMRAAALIEMAIRSASAGENAPARPHFTVLIGEDRARELCQLASGVVVHPTEIVPYIDAATMESILFDGPTTVVGVSTQRSFTGALRRAIIARDRFCTHPSGCDVPAQRCDIDHIVPWAQGGETRQENGRARCSTHNRHPDMVGPAEAARASREIRRTDIERVRRRWRIRHGLAPPVDDAA